MNFGKLTIKQAEDLKSLLNKANDSNSAKSIKGDYSALNSIFNNGVDGKNNTTENIAMALAGGKDAFGELGEAEIKQYVATAALMDKNQDGVVDEDEFNELDGLSGVANTVQIDETDIQALMNSTIFQDDAKLDDLLTQINDILEGVTTEEEVAETVGINLDNSGVKMNDDRTYSVTVEPWNSQADGRAANDCLSRIISNAYPDLSKEDRQAVQAEICEMNGIEDPNLIYSGANLKLPVVSYDENGKIQFSDKVEQKEVAETEEVEEKEEVETKETISAVKHSDAYKYALEELNNIDSWKGYDDIKTGMNTLNAIMADDSISVEEKADLMLVVAEKLPKTNETSVGEFNAFYGDLKDNMLNILGDEDLSAEKATEFAKGFEFARGGESLVQYLSYSSKDNAESSVALANIVDKVYSSNNAYPLSEVLELFPVTESIQYQFSGGKEIKAVQDVLESALDRVDDMDVSNTDRYHTLQGVANEIDSKNDLSSFLKSDDYTDAEKAQVLKEVGSEKIAKLIKDMVFSSNEEKYLTQVFGCIAAYEEA